MRKRGFVDLSHSRFGHWLVLKTYRENVGKFPRTLNECRCDCGATAIIRSENLLKGRSNGCSFCARRKKPNKYHPLNDGTLRVICANGSVFIVDASDADFVKKHQWCAVGRYFGTSIKGRRLLLHRLLLGLEDRDDVTVDHISGDSSDNRRHNLRICRQSDNSKNQVLSEMNTSGYKGVTFHRKAKQYLSQITHNYKNYYLGLYDSPEKAAAAYDEAAVLLHGEFARTNAMIGLLEVSG